MQIKLVVVVVLKQRFLKVYPPYFYCILKNIPLFPLILKILPSPHSKHRPPPLGINNEQSLKTVSALIQIPFKTTQKGTGTPVNNNVFIK